MPHEFPYHPTNATYASQVDFSAVAVTDTRVILDVPLPIGQPYTLNAAELSTGFPVTGPSSLACILTATGSYGTGESVEFTLGRRSSLVVQNTGPFRLTARPMQAALTQGPVISCWVAIEPTVPVSWPILSGVEVVPAVAAVVALNGGFPAPYRPNLTLVTNNNIVVNFLDLAGNIVGNYALNAQQCSELFNRMPIDPQLRLQLGQGPGPAATFVSISWSD